MPDVGSRCQPAKRQAVSEGKSGLEFVGIFPEGSGKMPDDVAGAGDLFKLGVFVIRDRAELPANVKIGDGESHSVNEILPLD